MSSYNTEMAFSDSGKVKVSMYAIVSDQYIVDEKKYMDLPEGLKIVFYDSLMNETSRLTANRGKYFETERKMEVNDDVVFVNPKGEKLNTEQLIWDQDSASIYTERAVKITKKNTIIRGKGLIANEDFSEYRIKKVTGQIPIPQENQEPTPKEDE